MSKSNKTKYTRNIRSSEINYLRIKRRVYLPSGECIFSEEKDQPNSFLRIKWVKC